MKLVTFEFFSERAPHAGLLLEDTIVDLAPLGVTDSVTAVQAGTDALLQAANMPACSHISPSAVRLLAPIPQPPRIFCIGLNYRDHAVESKMEIPKVPTVFLKLASAVIGPEEPVRIPALTKQPDYEVEFAIVIGKAGRNIAKEDWREHVFGYTILNDVSARDIQLATSQWTLGKSFDTFCPIGPTYRHRRRNPRPAQPRYQAFDRRRSPATLQHPRTHLQSARADRVHFLDRRARARRHHQHRHAGWRRTRPHAAALAASLERS
jgi:2-keto-4-pentenoate hydratase/2-oxohepta-3-ene-1,7-dioic acid hydratase in catechol pathway